MLLIQDTSDLRSTDENVSSDIASLSISIEYSSLEIMPFIEEKCSVRCVACMVQTDTYLYNLDIA